jgi:cystathionine beta-lyase
MAETPSPPRLLLPDVPALVAVAQAHGLKTVMDNTWATALFFTGIEKGVDLVVTAATKYLGGHSDVMMGAVTANAASWPALRRTAQMLGHFVGADDSYLVLRGLRTLALRLGQHQDSALHIAHWLADQPEVARVLHPALPSDPGHAIWRRDFAGASGLLRGAEGAHPLCLFPVSTKYVTAAARRRPPALPSPSDAIRPWMFQNHR